MPGRSVDDPLYVRETPADQSPIQQAGTVLAYAAGPIGTAGLVAVFLLFMLLQRDDLRDRVIKLAAGGKINLATQALDDAARRIIRYLTAQGIVNGTYGIAIGIGLTAISLAITGTLFPGVILWAALCAILRFIPYLGPWLAASFPILVSLGHYDGFAVVACVIGMFVVIELVSNNVMEPILYGSAVGMSDFAVILAATVWTFLWGPVGLLVATPLTTCLVVLGKYVPALGFFDTLLGDEPVLAPHARLYQRMLAMDADDAHDEVEAYRKQHSLTETYDDLMMPALALSERDREAGNLSPERSEFIRGAMRFLVDELAEQHDPLPADSVDVTDPEPLTGQSARLADARVVILPSSDDADETAAVMLKALLDRRGFTVTVADDAGLANEKLREVAEQGADVVVVSAMPPRAVARARYLVKRMSAAGVTTEANIPVIVGLWATEGNVDKAIRRVVGTGVVGDGGVDRQDLSRQVKVVTTLDKAAEAVRQRAEVATARRNSSATPDDRPQAAAMAEAALQPQG